MDAVVSYLESITDDDTVLIVQHWDMDGSAAAAILSHIVDTVRGRPADDVTVPEGRKHAIGNRIAQRVQDGANKLIVVDMHVPADRVEELHELGADVLVIDHHTFDAVPEHAVFYNPRQEDPDAYVPAAKLCNDVAKRFDLELDWIAGMGVIQDFAVAGNEELFERLRASYPYYFPEEITQQNLAKHCRYGTYSAVLNIKPYKDTEHCVQLAYDALMNARGLKYLEAETAYGTLREYQTEMRREIERIAARFDEERTVDEEEQLVFFQFDSDYHINSSIATQISLDREDWIHIIANTHNGTANISARCQSGRVDLGTLLKQSLPEDVEGEAGGHRKAAGASFPAEHIDEFRENVLTALRQH